MGRGRRNSINGKSSASQKLRQEACKLHGKQWSVLVSIYIEISWIFWELLTQMLKKMAFSSLISLYIYKKKQI